MAEQEKPTLTACYQVKHYSDGHVEFESIGATPLTDAQIHADIKSLGDQITKIEKDNEKAILMQNVVAGTIRALMPEIVGAVKASLAEEDKPGVKKLTKDAAKK